MVPWNFFHFEKFLILCGFLLTDRLVHPSFKTPSSLNFAEQIKHHYLKSLEPRFLTKSLVASLYHLERILLIAEQPSNTVHTTVSSYLSRYWSEHLLLPTVSAKRHWHPNHDIIWLLCHKLQWSEATLKNKISSYSSVQLVQIVNTYCSWKFHLWHQCLPIASSKEGW